ncbi:Hypp9435 [Branchiostoma lanceolatum]|nr:Hypp9435 [Branchiostoma lanceolatum]
MELLREWQKRKGKEATLEVLMVALLECLQRRAFVRDSEPGTPAFTEDMRAEEGEDLYVHVTLLGVDGDCQDDSFSDEETQQDIYGDTASHRLTVTEHHKDPEHDTGTEPHVDTERRMDTERHPSMYPATKDSVQMETGAGNGVQQRQTDLMHQEQQQEEPFCFHCYYQLMVLANRVGPYWTWLALQLGFTSTDMERISSTYHPSWQAHWCL